MSLNIDSLYFKRGSKEILYNINLFAQEGKILCLLGPSGSGKTTLLRLLSGLEESQRGIVTIGNKILSNDTFNLPPQERSTGFVFQENTLFPHLTVYENIAFGIKDIPLEEREKIIFKLLAEMSLNDLVKRYPDTLSGGQKQRVALAQALARTPKVMLLDEPFNSVDPQLRTELRNHTRQLLISSNIISIIVTHDPLEALDIADYIGVIEGGLLHQVDTVESIWNNPVNKYVLMACGECQKIRVMIKNNTLYGPFGKINKSITDRENLPDVFIRPNSFILSKKRKKNNDMKVSVDSILFKGNFKAIKFKLSDETFFSILDKSMGNLIPGDDIYIEAENIKYYVF